MSAPVAEERFDWRGPAVPGVRRSLLRRLAELVVPPKGQKVVPTGAGMLLIFIGLTIGLAAYNTVNNILFSALALLIAALILSGFICWGNLLCARWRLEIASTFRVGEESTATVVVENARKRFPLFCVSFGLETEAVSGGRRLYLRERLEPGESASLVWRFKPEKRMRAKVLLKDVASSFPFGFLAKFLPGECEREISVWPARIPYERYRNQIVTGAMQGRSSRKPGVTGELIGLREYEKGDALRSIHWRISAKQGRLIVKQNATETQALLDLVVDPSSYLWKDEGAFEKMCSFAGSLAEDLFLEGKLRTCCVLGSEAIRIQRVADLESFFDALASLRPVQSGADRLEFESFCRVNLRPLSGGGTGAWINDVQFAQA